jgi:hypothetical protein
MWRPCTRWIGESETGGSSVTRRDTDGSRAHRLLVPAHDVLSPARLPTVPRRLGSTRTLRRGQHNPQQEPRARAIRRRDIAASAVQPASMGRSHNAQKCPIHYVITAGSWRCGCANWIQRGACMILMFDATSGRSTLAPYSPHGTRKSGPRGGPDCVRKLSDLVKLMVARVGIEPTTFRFSDGSNIRLNQFSQVRPAQPQRIRPLRPAQPRFSPHICPMAGAPYAP